MSSWWLAIAIATIIFVVGWFIYTEVWREGYATRPEKIEAIHDWWEDNGHSPSYERYKTDVNSDIVEYDRVKDLTSRTKENIRKVL